MGDLLSNLRRGRISPTDLNEGQREALRAHAYKCAARKEARLRSALARGDIAIAEKIAADILRQPSTALWAACEQWPRLDFAEKFARIELIDCFAAAHSVREKLVPKRSGAMRRTLKSSAIDRARQKLLRLALSGSAVDVRPASWPAACEEAREAIKSAPPVAHFAVMDVRDAFGAVSHEFALSLAPHVPAAALRATLLEAFPRAQQTCGLEGVEEENQNHETITDRTDAFSMYSGGCPLRAGAGGPEPQTLNARRGSPQVGLPQGNSLSSMFAEAALKDALPTLSAGATLIRFADDLLIIGEEREAARRAEDAIRQSLIEARSGPFHCRSPSHGPLKSVSFLGYRFHKIGGGILAEPDPERREQFEIRIMSLALEGMDVERRLRGYLASFHLWRGAFKNAWCRAWAWRAARRHDWTTFLPRAV